MAPKNQRWWLTEDSVELEIEADAGVLYGMVSDLPRIGEWSPECESVDLGGRVTAPVENTTFMGHNAVGPGRRIRYSRHGRVLIADPGREFAFITDEGGRESTVWRYRFEPWPTAGRGSPSPTRCGGSRPGPASSTSRPTATRSCSEGMRTTLERLKADGRGRAPPHSHAGPGGRPVMTTASPPPPAST